MSAPAAGARRQLTRAAAALLVLGLATAAPAEPATPAPSSSDVDIAKAHFATGQAYYEHHRFADAAHEFEEAYRLSGRAPLLYNVGKSYDGASDLARALAAYRRFLEAAPADSADRDEVHKRVGLLATLVGTVTLHGALDGSTLTVDDAGAATLPLAAPLTVNPGRHTLVVAHERYASVRRTVDVPVGGSVYVEIQQVESFKVVTVAAPAHVDQPVYKKWWLWVAVGGAVAAAGIITAVVLTSDSSGSAGTSLTLPGVR